MDIGQAVLSVLLISGLIYMFVKSDRTEELLFPKLIGYCFLGSFRFNLNRIAIPLGFIIYMLWMHPKQNAASKRQAVILGLVFFLIGLVAPAVENYIYRLPIEVETQWVNIFDIDFQRDWLAIKQRLELPDDTRIEYFDAEFEGDGSIRNLCYQLIARGNEGLVLYDVSLGGGKKAYRIRRTRLDQWLQYGRLVTAARFFEVLTILDIEEIKPQQDYEYYCISGHGEAVPYGITNREKFLVDGNNGDISSIGDRQLPVKCYYISVYGMAKMGETSYESRDVRDYLFDAS